MRPQPASRPGARTMQAPPTPRILVKWPASGEGDELPLMLVRQRPFGAVAQEAADGEQVGMLRV